MPTQLVMINVFRSAIAGLSPVVHSSQPRKVTDKCSSSVGKGSGNLAMMSVRELEPSRDVSAGSWNLGVVSVRVAGIWL